ncbi:MAG: ATP-grasp domain-containing protein [Clostridia bacterium]|nr:ATP-grasp domain-containing protein [Clostridia bacterium]
MKKKFNVLILGSDFNSYYMARCYHELYHEKVNVIAKRAIGVVSYSNIVNFKEVPNFETEEGFVQTLNEYAKTRQEEKILLIGTSDELVRLIIENQSKLDAKYVHNYPSLEILNQIAVKDTFYQTFEGSELEVPKTYIYPCGSKESLDEKQIEKLKYPLIVKPGNNIEYHTHKFEGMFKVFKVFSKQELEEVVKKIENSGYKSNLVIQEFIPGDDCALFDSVFYCSKEKKVQLITLAQIGLQERNPGGIGNCTVLVNGFNEHGYDEKIVEPLKNFMERIGYQGFAEFDLKYDYRDGKYKVLEINPRQARCSYYLAAGGHNLVEYLIDDLIYHKEKPCTLMKEKIALSFVPKSVIKKYVTSTPLRDEILMLAKQKKLVNPLKYKKDTSIRRKLYLIAKDFSYKKKYKKLSW